MKLLASRENGAAPRRSTLVTVLALVFLLAIALRVGHLAGLRAHWEGTHAFATARVDAADHMRDAHRILDEDPWMLDGVYWKGPGYSYFLAGVMSIVGRDAGSLRWILALLGAVNCAGLLLLALRIVPLRVAALAAALTAVNGLLIIFDTELYHPTLLVALNLSALALLLRPEPSALHRAGSGLLFGLAALVHPSYLLVAGAVAIWLFRTHGRAAVPFILAVTCAVSPATLKNLLLHRQFVPISWSGGINLYIGNQPGFDQLSGQGTQAWDRVYSSLPDAGIESEAARSRFYARLAAAQLFASPLTGLRIFLDKTRVFFSSIEISNNFRIYELRQYSPVAHATLGRIGPLLYPFGVWAPLAWCGAILLWRRRAPGNGLLLFWSAGIFVSCVLFFNTARYRAPLVFLDTIWAAVCLDALCTRLRDRRWSQLIRLAAALIVLTVATCLITRPQRTLPPPLEFSEALVLESKGRIEEATQLLARICAAEPDNANLALATAALHAQHGRVEASRAYLGRVLAMSDPGPDFLSNAHEMLARSYLRTGDLADAERSFRDALQIGVDDTRWHGVRFFVLGLPPVTACRLELGLAEVYLRRRDADAVRGLVQRVRQRCESHGRIGAGIKALEPGMRALELDR